MKRVRLLIYEGSPESLEKQRLFDGVQGFTKSGKLTITSIELNPLRITILELLRLFWREAKR